MADITAKRESTKGETADPKSLRRVQGYIGRLMWLARTGRPDICHSVGLLASVVGIWDELCERGLQRLVGYLKHTRSNALEYLVLQEHNLTLAQLCDRLTIHVYVDASSGAAQLSWWCASY